MPEYNLEQVQKVAISYHNLMVKLGDLNSSSDSLDQCLIAASLIDNEIPRYIANVPPEIRKSPLYSGEVQLEERCFRILLKHGSKANKPFPEHILIPEPTNPFNSLPTQTP